MNNTELLLVSLDPRTIMMMNIVGTLLMGTSLFVVSRGYLGQIKGIYKWGVATLLQSLGWFVVGALREYIPEVLSIVIGNGLILLSLGMYFIIIRNFNNRTTKTFWVYPLLGLALIFLAYFTLVSPDVGSRIIILSACAATFMCSSSYILLSDKNYRPYSHLLSGILFAICGAILTMRFIYTMATDSYLDQNAFGKHPLQDFSYITFFITSVMLTFCFVLMCNDRYISQRKQAEEELLKSKKLAEQLAGAKDQFLSNMSHEIRTPLNGIIGFTKLLLQEQQGTLTAKQRQQVELIKTSSDILLVLINDILDLAKINDGKMSMEENEFSLDELITDILASFHQRMEEKNLNVVSNFDETIPKVLVGDVVRISQVLINLINNSKKFTPDGGKVTLDVSLLEQDADNARIQFTISDTGIGIGKEKMATIFDPFVQDNTSQKYEGTGLGLSIVKRLVNLMDGTISIESEVNKGTSVIVAISFKKADESTEKRKIKETSALMGELPQLGPLKILLAEDNTINQLLAQTILHQFGFEVDTAENGKIAIEYASKKSYDIILMDLKMPEMGGYEATQYIRTQFAPPKSLVPIIAITADVTKADIEKYKECGMNDYVLKPFEQTELLNKIISLTKDVNSPKALNH